MADDGSSVADCWATGQAATELLGFPSLFENTSTAPNTNKQDLSCTEMGSEIEASPCWCIVMGILLWKLKVGKQKQRTFCG
jgi:hypothetical protein